MKNKLLVIAAHPDDDILGCGGTLSKYDYKKTFYNHRNNLLMLFKNLPLIDLILVLTNRLIIQNLV